MLEWVKLTIEKCKKVEMFFHGNVSISNLCFEHVTPFKELSKFHERVMVQIKFVYQLQQMMVFMGM